MESFFIGIIILVFSAIIQLFFKNQSLKIKIISFGSILSSLFTVFNAINVFLNEETTTIFRQNSIFQNVIFAIDNISAFFILFISIISTLALIYANGYLTPYIKKGKDLSAHCFFLPLLIASMLGVVTVQNALLFLIIWEIMSLSSFFLVIFENEKKEVLNAGIKYLVYMHISVIFIILLFALLSIESGSLNFESFRDVLMNNPNLSNLAFILAFIGFGIKAGFVPFHNWLPDAHPKAPSHVSAMMSGVMIKTGIYGIIRILELSYFPKIETIYIVLTISIITALYGICYAAVQKDIKKMLAYSSIENIGIIGTGLSTYLLAMHFEYPTIGVIALCGTFAHILNHSIFKELLFLSAGSVYIKTHTKDMEILGGLIKKMPTTAFCFIIGSVSICALPPFNGFVSEFLIYLSFIDLLNIEKLGVFIVILFALATLALVGTIAIMCFTKTISITFLGEAREKQAQDVTQDSPKTMLIPMKILACSCLFIGTFPQLLFKLALKPTEIFIDYGCACKQIAFLNSISKYLLILLGIFAFLLMFKKLISKKSTSYSTWGCGYNKLTPKVQYSAASYINPFLTILKPLFKRTRDVKKAKGLFPTDVHYETKVEDIEEAYIINPIVKWDEKFFSKFERLQNGDIQQYIRFGLIFLALALVMAIILR